MIVDKGLLSQIIAQAFTFAGVVVVAFFGWLTSKAAREARDTSNANHETLKTVEQNVNGKLSAIEGKLTASTIVGEKLSTEVARLQEPGTTTPTGAPTEANPVTLTTGGVPTTDPESHHNGGV